MREKSVNRADTRSIVAEAALFFLVFFLPGALTTGAGDAPDMTNVLAWTVLLAVPQALLMILVAGLRGDLPPSACGLERPRPREILLSIPVAAALLLVSLAVSRIPARIMGTGYRWKLDSPWQIPLALAAGLATGYREEFFFRPYLLLRLRSSGAGTAAAVLLSTALFASCHVYEGAGGILLAVLEGIGFSALFLRIPSLHLLAFAHGLYNAAVLAAGIAFH